jgi:putative ABC transport system permease protein
LLTKEIAEKYFGDWKTAMGKTIKLTGGYIFEHGFVSVPEILKVSGILATIPANTDFQLKLVVLMEQILQEINLRISKSTDWNENSADFGCYVLLPPNVSADNFNQQLRAYSRKVESPAIRIVILYNH